MKKKLLYCLTALIALGFSSCSDDDEFMGGNNPAEDFDRMPMTMFRLKENTNVDDDTDEWSMRTIHEELNSIQIAWYGVQGAGGYEVKFGFEAGLTSGKEEDWNNTDRLYQWPDGKYSKVFRPDELRYIVRHLEYEQGYRFAIRVLHPDYVKVDPQTGEITEVIESTKHSKWYGYGNGREWAEQAGKTTDPRYTTPKLVKVEVNESNDAFIVTINRNVIDHIKDVCDKESDYEAQFKDFKEHFEFVEDGTENDMYKAKFKVTHLKMAPSSDTPDANLDGEWRNRELKDADFKDGIATFVVGNLTQNAKYSIDAVNNDIPVAVDARYNSWSKPIYGTPGEAIKLKHIVWKKDPIPGAVEYNASPLDTILGNFANNVKLAEGQTFYLEGGKAYYFYNHPTLAKGFTLATDPEDVAKGLRATVYMGGMGVQLDEYGAETANLNTCNFMFGRQRAAGESDFPIEVGSIIFENIDFDCPKALNFGHQSEGIGTASGNYFANMYSDGMEVSFKSLEIRNCTFQRMVRGFIRVQGKKDKTFEKIVIDGNVFYNCGYYDNNGRGYAWIAGDGAKATSNIYKDFSWTNNTMYDCPRTAMISDNDKNLNYTDNVQWNIKIEGNTFINFSTRSSGRNFFQTKYVPGGSYYSFQRNLIVLAADDADERVTTDKKFYQGGAAIETIKGSGDFTFCVKDNYYVGCKPSHVTDDKIFTGTEFSNTKNSFGASKFEKGNLGTKDDLKVKVLKDDNGNVMKATDLFTNPNAPYKEYDSSKPNHRDHEAPADIFNALKYKTVPSIITSKNIGDPRWR